MVVTTKKKIELKNKESRPEIITRMSGALPDIEMQKYDTVELDVKKYEQHKQYDTEGIDLLLNSDRKNLNPNEINIQVNQGKWNKLYSYIKKI